MTAYFPIKISSIMNIYKVNKSRLKKKNNNKFTTVTTTATVGSNDDSLYIV